MSTKKDQKIISFRIDTQIIDKLKELTEKESVIFRSASSTAAAAMYYFLNLPKEKQFEAFRDYLTRNLK